MYLNKSRKGTTMRLQLDILMEMDVLMGGVDWFWPDLCFAENFLIISGHFKSFSLKKKTGYRRTDGPTDGPTNRPTDKTSYRDAEPHLKRVSYLDSLQDVIQNDIQVDILSTNFTFLEALWAPTRVKSSFGSTEHLPCWSYEKNNIRFGFSMSKTQILTPMLIYFRPLSFFTPRGALTGPRGGESAGSPPGLLNIPTNCILTKDGTFCRMRSLPHIFVAMALHYLKENRVSLASFCPLFLSTPRLFLLPLQFIRKALEKLVRKQGD